ncbi:hypothetical protein Droror1_Dr00013919 [Drosera rotundifolia]
MSQDIKRHSPRSTTMPSRTRLSPNMSRAPISKRIKQPGNSKSLQAHTATNFNSRFTLQTSNQTPILIKRRTHKTLEYIHNPTASRVPSSPGFVLAGDRPTGARPQLESKQRNLQRH